MAKMNYARFAATALRLLDKAGKQMTLVRRTEGGGSSYDPGDPIETEYTVTGVILPASKGLIESFDNRLEGGALIDSKLRACILAAQGLAIEPLPWDLIRDDGTDWTVLGCTPIKPANLPIVYRLGLKL